MNQAYVAVVIRTAGSAWRVGSDARGLRCGRLSDRKKDAPCELPGASHCSTRRCGSFASCCHVCTPGANRLLDIETQCRANDHQMAIDFYSNIRSAV